MAHHYDDSDTSFGITSGVFDRAFGTAPRAKAKTT
jgi:sterol desaturase/sphingolipid hydroxylase (fatty acid hydroxylase superfamily)